MRHQSSLPVPLAQVQVLTQAREKVQQALCEQEQQVQLLLQGRVCGPRREHLS